MILSGAEWQVLAFSLVVSALSLLLVVLPALLLAILTARWKHPVSSLLEAIATLPLAIPPVATGLFLLKVFSRQHVFGRWLYESGIVIPFSTNAVIVALAIMSFPLVYRPMKAGFEAIDPELLKLCRTQGRSPLYSFFHVQVPLARHALIAGLLLGWARALGEFGCTIVFAGDVAGETRTLALAIFNYIEFGQDIPALRLALITVFITLGLVVLAGWVMRRGTSESFKI